VDFSLGKFNVTLDWFCGQPIGTLEISTSQPLGTVLGVRQNPDVIPSKVSFSMRDLNPI